MLEPMKAPAPEAAYSNSVDNSGSGDSESMQAKTLTAVTFSGRWSFPSLHALSSLTLRPLKHWLLSQDRLASSHSFATQTKPRKPRQLSAWAPSTVTPSVVTETSDISCFSLRCYRQTVSSPDEILTDVGKSTVLLSLSLSVIGRAR